MNTIAADTIYALSSAPGRAGVAVVRLSGPGSGPALRTLGGRLPEPRTATLRPLKTPASGQLIDRGLLLWFPGPASFTGEDCAEFHIHGGRAVISALFEALDAQPGLRLAEAGEFARRAFENGKLDLTAAEGLADLIDAETAAQHAQAIEQAGGRLARLYESWRGRLIEALALQEAGIDFSDQEDIAADASSQAKTGVERLFAEITDHLADENRGEILRDGFQVAIVGPPNAGKSSLLNALARRDVAIVSADAGTTRDVIEVRLDLAGLPVIVSDTAGLRPSAGEVEQEGMRRAMARAKSANLVIWLIDGSSDSPRGAPPSKIADMNSIVLPVLNKSDLLTDPADLEPTGDWVAISARTGDGLGALTRRIADIAAERIGTSAAPSLTRQRHRQQLMLCQSALNGFLDGAADDIELRADDLRCAAAALGRITGRIDVEDILDQVFSSFCIGK